MNSELLVLDLGRQPYQPVLERQEQAVADRKAGRTLDTLFLVEHDPVYTLGRNAQAANVLVSQADRERMGIEMVSTSRGGDVTYHGPGQLVGYPVLDLGAGGGRRVAWYVGRLEEVLIRALAHYGVSAGRDKINRGVWVGLEKIAALGVRITGQVTMHGFALNVAVDLDHYRGIVPCGLTDRGVTSLNRLVPGITVEQVKPCLVQEFKHVFGYTE